MLVQNGNFASAIAVEALGDGKHLLVDTNGNRYVITARFQDTKQSVRRTQLAVEGYLNTLVADGAGFKIAPGLSKKISLGLTLAADNDIVFSKTTSQTAPTATEIALNANPRNVLSNLICLLQALMSNTCFIADTDAKKISKADVNLGAAGAFTSPLLRASMGMDPVPTGAVTLGQMAGAMV